MSSEFKVWNFNHRTAGKSQGGLFCLELRRVLRHLSQEKVLLANVFFFFFYPFPYFLCQGIYGSAHRMYL